MVKNFSNKLYMKELYGLIHMIETQIYYKLEYLQPIDFTTAAIHGNVWRRGQTNFVVAITFSVIWWFSNNPLLYRNEILEFD